MTTIAAGNVSTVASHLEAARELERIGNLEEALVHCQRALKLAPTHPAAQALGTRLLVAITASNPRRFLTAPIGKTHPPNAANEPCISVVVCSVDTRKFSAVCSNYEQLLAAWRHEIIGIHDAKSLCEGYNRGSARARGDVIVFSHDDIEILSTDFAWKLTRLLRDYDMIGVAGSTRFPTNGFWFPPGAPYVHGQVAHRAPGDKTYRANVFGVGGPVAPGIQVLDGVFFAVRRLVLETVRFDEVTFDGFHFYDIDFSYQVFSAGFRVAVSNEIILVHQSSGNFGEEWRKYARRFLAKYDARVHATPTVIPTYWTTSVVRLMTRQHVAAYFTSLVATATTSV